MDTLSHAGWGWLALHRVADWRWVVAFGVLPDVVSFGPHLLSGEHFAGGHELFDAAYRYAHSLVIVGLLFAGSWIVLGRPPLAMLAWAAHIATDALTHPAAFYPTPYLYPFDSPIIGLTDYRSPWFALVNYTMLGAALLTWAYVRHVRRRSEAA